MKMNKDTEEKVVQFLRTMAEGGNWEYYQNNDIGENKLEWVKSHYDPQFVAQELLDLIFPEGQDV